MKILRITMPDNSKWDVPAAIVANNRADYYAKKESKNIDEYNKIFNQEYLYTLKDEEELIDWAANNMNWKDVKENAKCSKLPPATDFQEGWVNGEKKVLNVRDE